MVVSMALCRVLARYRPLFCYNYLNKSIFPLSTGIYETKSHVQRQFFYSNCENAPTSEVLTTYGSRDHRRGSENIANGRTKFYFAILSALVVEALYVKRSLKAFCEQDEANEKPSMTWGGLKITLYQYQTCPFCCKVRAFLQFYQIPFEMVEVHPIFKKEINFSEYKKVPIVTIESDGETQQLQDSSLIISILRTYMENNERNITDIAKEYPMTEMIDESGEKKNVVLNKYWIIEKEEDKAVIAETDPRKDESYWREWTDSYLVHLISPNVYRTYIEAYQAFDHHVKLGRFNGTWEGTVAKIGGSVAMWLISKRLKKKYNLNDDVRLDLYSACNTWVKAIGKQNKFMGGNKPNLADLSVYGVLSVMEGLTSFEDMMKNTNNKVKRWYYRMKSYIEEPQPQ